MERSFWYIFSPPRWPVLQTEKSNKYLKLSFFFHFQNYTYFLFYIINDQNLFNVPSYRIHLRGACLHRIHLRDGSLHHVLLHGDCYPSYRIHLRDGRLHRVLLRGDCHPSYPNLRYRHLNAKDFKKKRKKETCLDDATDLTKS